MPGDVRSWSGWPVPLGTHRELTSSSEHIFARIYRGQPGWPSLKVCELVTTARTDGVTCEGLRLVV